MKVLHSGNIASIGYNLCKGLRTKGVEADLVYQRSSGIVEGTTEKWIKVYTQPPFKFKSFQKLKNRLENLTLPGIDLSQYDLFQLNYLKTKLNYGIALQHKLKNWKKPIVVYLLGSKTSAIKSGRQGMINKIITSRAKLILSGSPRQFPFIQHYPNKKVLLPIPIDTNKFRAIKTETYEDRILCWVKPEKQKGIDIIFKTAKLMPNLQFDLPSPKISTEAEYFNKIKPKNVVFLPEIPHEQAPDLINKYPLIIGQFLLGGYGMSELEAMACAKPVIAYINVKYEDHYDKPCPILSSRDPPEIRELIQANIGNKQLGNSSRKWVKNIHSVERVTGKLVEIYKSVIEK